MKNKADLLKRYIWATVVLDNIEPYEAAEARRIVKEMQREAANDPDPKRWETWVQDLEDALGIL